MLIDVIVCDLVALRERGKFVGMIMSIFTVLSSSPERLIPSLV
jgi:flavin reductase (DIM6/NTAB) family NADH-FMN oxidoreductase RutF